MQSFAYVRFKNQKESLIDFLCRRFPYQDQASWRVNISRGSLTINGALSTPETILETGMIIGYNRPREDEPAIDRSHRILYEDAEIVVVEKSGNLPISESGKFYRNTLLHVLAEDHGYEELYAVHRLDRETSGIVCVARQKEIATRMGEMFFAGIPQKEYTALLLGEMNQAQVMVDQPIRKVHASDHPGTSEYVRIRQVIRSDGKPSRTLFTKLAAQSGLTLVKVRLFTGRTHQIRCHAEFMGHPLLGDKLYGQSDADFIAIFQEEKPPLFPPFGQIDRQMLHASQLSFPHPKTGEPLSFASEALPFFSGYSGLDPFLKSLYASQIDF